METQNELQNIRPSVGSAYGLGWKRMFKYFLYAFLVIIFMGITNIPVSWTCEVEHIDFPIMFNFFTLFTVGYFFFLAAPLKYGAKKVYLSIVREEEINMKDLFYGFKDYINIILANLLTVAIIGIGILFFLVPGIIFACRLVFVPFLVVDKKLDAVKAVEESWRMTKGHGWKIFFMGLLVPLIIIAGLASLFVGIIFAIIWISLAFTSLYAILMAKKEQVTV